MRHGLVTSMLAIFLALGLAGCRDEATLPVEAGTGPDPKLPPPKQRLIPTVDVAHAIGWPAGATPHAAPGFEVKALARDLAHPRWLYVLPNGDVLVAETSAPPQPGRRVSRPRSCEFSNRNRRYRWNAPLKQDCHKGAAIR